MGYGPWDWFIWDCDSYGIWRFMDVKSKTVLDPWPAIFNSRFVCLTSLSSFLNLSDVEILLDILGVIINGFDFKIACSAYAKTNKAFFSISWMIGIDYEVKYHNL